VLSAVILAAGASRRMGSPKALLTIGGRTFLRHICATLASARIGDVTIVLGAGAEEIRKTLGWFEGRVALNPEWEQGQLSSIIAGLDVIPPGRARGALIWPVDHPLVSPAVPGALLSAFERSNNPIVIPTYEGRRGHPAIFGASLFDELRHAPQDAGARALIRNHSGEVEEVATLEPGVCIDIATINDYEREILRAGP
jgi:molybdenum cofactor cytidylyltransferase